MYGVTTYQERIAAVSAIRAQIASGTLTPAQAKRKYGSPNLGGSQSAKQSMAFIQLCERITSDEYAAQRKIVNIGTPIWE
jgi:hypothetical protein